jgi:hypothetical protein
MKIKGITITQNDDMITIEGKSGEYVGFIEDDGTISFSVMDDEDRYEFDDDNWKDILGKKHVFVKIIDAIGGEVEALVDYVQITVEADKLLN